MYIGHMPWVIKAGCAQVLFCSLTGDQRDLYRAYLSSEEVQDILNVSTCSIDCVHRFHGGGCLARMLLLLAPWTGPMYLPG